MPADEAPTNSACALLQHVKALLLWTILTASTVGPGTVAMCAKAGADSKQKSVREALLLGDTIQKVATPTAANGPALGGRPSVSGGHSRTSKPVISEPPMTATLKHEIGLQKTEYSLSGAANPPSRPQTNSIMHRQPVFIKPPRPSEPALVDSG